jgi:hypothetical protein
MDAPDPRPEDPSATKAVVDPSATKAAVERGRDDARSRWGLLLIAAVVLVALVMAWKGPAILAFFAGPR